MNLAGNAPHPPADLAAPDGAAGRGSWFGSHAARAMFEANPCGIVLLSESGLVVDANAAFVVITGRSWREIAGRPLEKVLRRTDGCALGLPRTLGMGSTDSLQVEREVFTAGGEPMVLELTVMTIGGCPDLPLRAVQIVDLTLHRRAEAALREAAG